MSALPARFTAPPPPEPTDPQDGLYRFDRVAPLAEAADEAALRAYRDTGFLAVRDVYDAPTVEATLAGLAAAATRPDEVMVQYEDWARDRVEEFRGDRLLDGLRKLMNFVGHDHRLAAAAAHPAILAVVRRLIGAEPVLFQDMALLKPPGGGREKPWHQDHAFFDFDPDEPVVGVWIALDDATAANGAMHVLPGTHREGPVLHVQERDLQICDSWVQAGRDTVVPLPAGSALFFDGMLHHGTPPNRTGARRRAVQFHYRRADARHVTEAEHLRLFGAEAHGVTC